MAELPIRLARSDEKALLWNMLNVANGIAAEQSGEQQWLSMDAVQEQLFSGVDAGNCYVLTRHDDDTPLASVSVSDSDTYIWGEQGNDGQALYFHKLMKNPDLAPPMVSLQLLSRVALWAMSRQKTLVRCDTKANQTKLIRRYEELSFVEKGRIKYGTTDRVAVQLETTPEALLRATRPEMLLKR